MADYERWNKIKILIIDEISMASASDLKQISDRLQQLKGNHSIPFGGLDVIFAWDFSQLPSICYPLFTDYRKISSDVIIPPDVLAGAAIWFDWLNSALELSFNFGCTPTYANFLKRFRFNTPTETDLKTLNMRLVSSINMPPEKTPVIVPTNAERIAVINYCSSAYISKFACTFDNCLDWKKTGYILLLMDVQIKESCETSIFPNQELIKQYVRAQRQKSLGYLPG